MSDYSDYREWKEVELFDTGREYLSEHYEYSFDNITDILVHLSMVAIEHGLEGCFFKFESNYEPYEDFLGSPSVTVCGYRRLTEKERKEIKEQDRLNDLHKKTGVTPYEANIIRRLKEEGKLEEFLKHDL